MRIKKRGDNTQAETTITIAAAATATSTNNNSNSNNNNNSNNTTTTTNNNNNYYHNDNGIDINNTNNANGISTSLRSSISISSNSTTNRASGVQDRVAGVPVCVCSCVYGSVRDQFIDPPTYMQMHSFIFRAETSQSQIIAVPVISFHKNNK